MKGVIKMEFHEKLFRLRKEKGWSQELLAEKLKTTRQAVSKWENAQGFPETEKLLVLSQIFEVSIDYLLKDSSEGNIEHRGQGYYVSRENAQGYLQYEKVMTKYIAFGLSCFVLLPVPYFIFKGSPSIYTTLIILIAIVGIGSMSISSFRNSEAYCDLKKEALIFDPNVLKDLRNEFYSIRQRYYAVAVVGISLLMIGGIPFFLVDKGYLSSEIFTPYISPCILLIAVSVYMLVWSLSTLESYQLLVNNQAYIKKIEKSLFKKLQRKLLRKLE